MEYTHDHMTLTLQAMYPHLSHGKDYKVAMPVEQDGGQIGDPWITEWLAPDAKPKAEWVLDYFHQHEAEICAQYVRYHRDDRLAWSDRFTYTPPDAPPEVQAKTALWLEYRKALRDITTQPGFPLDVTWPELPT
ncbi:phage tail assembly chaperone [Burkholderia vietnamiensis]|uniref:XkdW family protein n=1 Tax=Burkholderia vietnamiensis TaxID=60552 RepID=UPI001594A93D|nr:phage tail assembly chaperone [Burkholderia vietnamiensis]MBR8006528.1 phage tail assembly chaperone [Burkholderia vietnamiensis]MDN7814726.1 phage tail assembly chaperone [Burkholderia vietnamiensis]MDN8042327.1 phage tail assembly chaperone [Burkholderia vietnamiensis]HDR9131372.1 phage tail assembly chaperone [Burkholderia vietnamiensis]